MFARGQHPATDAQAYLDARFQRYAEVRMACPRGEIEAFALVQPFEAEGEHHLYVGPMFSRGGACIELFCSMVYELLTSAAGAPFHIAAEIEHPAVLRSFGLLFPSSVNRAPGTVSVRTRNIALRFRHHVSHIGELDLCTLRTTVSEPLFAHGSVSPPDAQLVLVSADGSLRSRNTLRAELAAGLDKLRRSAP